jgi:hypothetical protein
MINREDREQAFMDMTIKALSEGDLDAITEMWAEACTHQAIGPFDPGEIKRGREAIHAYAKSWSGVSDFQVLKNQVLSTDSDGSIGGRVK